MSDKITSAADLLAMAEKAKSGVDLRSGTKDITVTVHMGTCGIAAGARQVLAGFLTEIGAQGLDNVTVRQSGCAGLCEMEPMATVKDADGTVYHYGRLDDQEKVRQIVREHLGGGTPVSAYLVKSA
jgi:NADP-reducing hydrogenase subunit HndB